MNDLIFHIDSYYTVIKVHYQVKSFEPRRGHNLESQSRSLSTAQNILGQANSQTNMALEVFQSVMDWFGKISSWPKQSTFPRAFSGLPEFFPFQSYFGFPLSLPFQSS